MPSEMALKTPASVKRVLVIKLGHIGDVLVTTPVVRALHEAWPGVQVTAVVNQGTEAMMVHSPQIDQVLIVRRDLSGVAALRSQLSLLCALRRAKFDLALELSGGDRGALLSLASGAELRVGFEPKKPNMRAKAFHMLVDQRGTQNHVVDTFLRQPRALGIEPADTRMLFEPGGEARGKAADNISKAGLNGRPFALVHPTSRWMFKCWNADGVAAVINHLRRRGMGIVMTCAPDDHEIRYNSRVLEQTGVSGILNLSGKVDLLTLGALIERANLFFGVDSAPMHMAAALGTPVAVIFGPSGDVMWGPWQVASEVIAGDCPDRPCGRDGCEGSKVSRCLVELEPKRVIEAIERLLSKVDL